MTNMQAALGLAQLERLGEFVTKKRAMGKKYTELLKDLPCLQMPLMHTDYAVNIYWVYGLVLDESTGLNAEEAMKRLAAKGVGTRPFFYPMHQQPVLRRMGLFDGEQYPIAERLAKQGFYLPSGLALQESKLYDIARVLKDIF